MAAKKVVKAKPKTKATPQTEKQSEEFVFIPIPGSNQPLAMSIKAGKDYLAISIRYGHGSETMPAFGSYPTSPQQQVGALGGGDGEPGCQP